MKEQVQPNETTKELEKQREKSLSDFIKKNRLGQDVESEEETTEKPEKKEEKLDKDEKNSYINKDKEDSKDKEEETSDENLEEYQKVLENTFAGDPKKAVKSWKESQKNYAKLRNEAKQNEQKLEFLNELVEKNPILANVLETAVQKGNLTQDDLQNFLDEGQEPSGKPNKSSSKSKLENVDNFDVNDINVDTLVKSGYLNPDEKDSLSPTEWSIRKRQAAVKYAEDNIPQKLAQKAYQDFQKQIEAEREKKAKEDRQEQVQQLNAQRYEQGLERVVDEFNLDFAGNEEHEQLLDEIESVAVGIRDPQDNGVIHPNAMYLATIQVFEDKGIKPNKAVDMDEETEKAKQEVDESFDKRTGFNANTKQPRGQDEPQTWAEKLQRKNLEHYERAIEKRRKTGRINPDKSTN